MPLHTYLSGQLSLSAGRFCYALFPPQFFFISLLTFYLQTFKTVSPPKRKPSGADFVWRRGARERTQFSPKAETKLSGLCSEDKGCGLARLPKGDGRGNCPNPVPQRRNLSFSKREFSRKSVPLCRFHLRGCRSLWRRTLIAHSGTQREPGCEKFSFSQRTNCAGGVPPASSQYAVSLRQPPLSLSAFRCSNQRRLEWGGSYREDFHF